VTRSRTLLRLLCGSLFLILPASVVLRAAVVSDSTAVGNPLAAPSVRQGRNHLVTDAATARTQSADPGRCRTIRFRTAASLRGKLVRLLCPWGTAMLGWSVPVRSTPWRCASGGYRPDGAGCLIPPLPNRTLLLCRGGGRVPLYRYRVLGTCADAGLGRGLEVGITIAQTTIENVRRAARHGRRAVCCPLRTIYEMRTSETHSSGG
jgi:hypothetical protein